VPLYRALRVLPFKEHKDWQYRDRLDLRAEQEHKVQMEIVYKVQVVIAYKVLKELKVQMEPVYKVQTVHKVRQDHKESKA